MRKGFSVVTMSDVARAAGVSVMTVSNVLNERPRMSAETRDRVLHVVAELGYEINLTARGLRAGRTGTVALIVPYFDHPYFGELAARIDRRLERSGRHLVIEQSGGSGEGELTALSLARLQRYDGVLLSVVGLTRRDVDRLETSTPTVLLGEQEMPGRFDHIMMGNVEGARMATSHLLASGAARVAIVGGAVSDATSDGMAVTRARGWRLAHADHGVEADDRLMQPGYDMAGGLAAVRQMADVGIEFDAVFAVTDSVAMGVLTGLAERGVRVPDEVQVIGFDNLELSKFVPPGISSVDPDKEAIVERAVEVLERRIDRVPGDPELPPVHLTTDVRLIHRGSTRRAPR